MDLCWADNSRGWNRSKIIEREQKGWLSFNPILQVLSLPDSTCKIPTAQLRSGNGSEYNYFICLIHRKHFMLDRFGWAMNKLLDYKLNILEVVMFYKSPRNSAVNLNKRSAKFLNSWTVCTACSSISCLYKVSAYREQAQEACFMFVTFSEPC